MMEQAIQAEMVKLADQFVPVGGPRWRAARLAAQSFRQPSVPPLKGQQRLAKNFSGTGTSFKHELVGLQAMTSFQDCP